MYRYTYTHRQRDQCDRIKSTEINPCIHVNRSHVNCFYHNLKKIKIVLQMVVKIGKVQIKNVFNSSKLFLKYTFTTSIHNARYV